MAQGDQGARLTLWGIRTHLKEGERSLETVSTDWGNGNPSWQRKGLESPVMDGERCPTSPDGAAW